MADREFSATTRWLSDEEQRTWRAFLLATQLIDETLDRQLRRDANMPHAYYGILVALSEAPDNALRMSDLARHLRYSQSRMTHAISSMERSGWAKRINCPTDRRSQLVSITSVGTRVLDEAAPGHVAEVRSAMFDKLSDEQVVQMRDICTTLLAGLDSA